MTQGPEHLINQSTYLVTGGCGFVGRHLVIRLATAGARVFIVDDLSTGLPLDAWLASELRDRVTMLRLDVCEFFRLHCSPTEWRSRMGGGPPLVENVVHLAAVVGGRAKVEGDPIAVAQDLAIDAEFFAWAIRVRPHHLLYASSSAAYPVSLQSADRAIALHEGLITFEGTLGQPDMTYGWAKLTGEYLASIAARHYGLHIACVRPFSGYGEDQDTSYPIPAIAERAARQEDPLSIWGSGDQGRDFVHIEDCIDAMLLALNRIADGSAVNIGTGRLTTFKQIARMLALIAGYSPSIRTMDEKPVGVAQRFADIGRARLLLEWTPKVGLEEGLSRVYAAAVRQLKSRVTGRL